MFVRVREIERERERVCVCVCASERDRERKRESVCVCLCVCVAVCVGGCTLSLWMFIVCMCSFVHYSVCVHVMCNFDVFYRSFSSLSWSTEVIFDNISIH